MAFKRIMLALLFNHLPHSSSSSQTKNSLRVPRIVAFLSYLLTAVFFFSSQHYLSLPAGKTWIPIVFFFISAIPLFPLPALNLKTRLKNMFVYAILKSVGSFASNYVFNWIGSEIKMETDILMMNASLSFVFFMIAIDYIYDIDEDLGVCDGVLFAGFSLMGSQNVIPQWIVILVGSSLNFLKKYLPLYKEQSSGGINVVKESATKDSGDSGDVPEEKKGSSVVVNIPGVSGEEATIRQRRVLKKEQEMQLIEMQCKNITKDVDNIDF